MQAIANGFTSERLFAFAYSLENFVSAAIGESPGYQLHLLFLKLNLFGIWHFPSSIHQSRGSRHEILTRLQIRTNWR